MKNLLLIAALVACGGAVEDHSEYQDDVELGSVQQATIAACLKDRGELQYGTSGTSGSIWARCNITGTDPCRFPGLKTTFEVALVGPTCCGRTGWSSADKLEFGIGGNKAADFMNGQFTAWLALIDPMTGGHMRVNPNGFNAPMAGVAQNELTFGDKDYVTLEKVPLSPPWYANRATTTFAPLTDLVHMSCLSSIALTGQGTGSSQPSRCTKWAAQVDYDSMRGWALARGTNVQVLIESATKKIMAWAMGLAPGGGSGLTVSDRNLYPDQNPTTFANTTFGSEKSWVNNYQLTGEGFDPTVDACIRACGINNTCQNACRNTLYCTLE